MPTISQWIWCEQAMGILEEEEITKRPKTRIIMQLHNTRLYNVYKFTVSMTHYINAISDIQRLPGVTW